MTRIHPNNLETSKAKLPQITRTCTMVFSLRNRATGREKKRSLFQKELVIVEGKTKFDPIREKEGIATFVARVLFSRKRETMVHRRGG